MDVEHRTTKQYGEKIDLINALVTSVFIKSMSETFFYFKLTPGTAET